MSEEEDFMPSCDSADYDFGYSDNDASDQVMEDEEVDPENQYYQAKSMRESDPAEALAQFSKIIRDNPNTEIGVKANKQSLKLVVKQPSIGSVDDAFNSFLDAIVSSKINQSYRDQSFLNMLEVVKDTGRFEPLLQRATTKFNASSGCERLASRTTLKLAGTYFNDGNFAKSIQVLDTLGPLGLKDDDQWKTNLGLEVLALRIQIAMKHGTGEEEGLYETIRRGSQIQMAHPRILAVIRECGGVIAVRHHAWAEARTMLLKAFKSYDEAGSLDRMRVLQYYIVCSILTENGINPFDSQETLAYKQSPELSFLQDLVEAFIDTDLNRFQAVMLDPFFAQDPLVAKYMVEALHNCFQQQLLMKIVRPYSRVTFQFVASKLDVDIAHVPLLFTRQILAKKLAEARIDDVNKVVEFGQKSHLVARQVPASKLALPTRYKEFADSTERDKFEKAILLAKENQKKERSDFSRVYNELIDATQYLHMAIRAP